MKKLLLIFILSLSSIGVTYAITLTDTQVETRIQSIQGGVPTGTPTLTNTSYDRKGNVGSMLSNIFDTADQKIKSYFIQAFRNILGASNQNNIAKWNGQAFQTGAMWDVSGNVGVGTGTISPGLKLDVDGKLGANEYCDKDGGNCFKAGDVQTSSAFTEYTKSVYGSSVLLETPQAYDMCMISQNNLRKRGGWNYNYGGGCSINETISGTWVLRTQGRTNVTATCSMLCR